MAGAFGTREWSICRRNVACSAPVVRGYEYLEMGGHAGAVRSAVDYLRAVLIDWARLVGAQVEHLVDVALPQFQCPPLELRVAVVGSPARPGRRRSSKIPHGV